MKRVIATLFICSCVFAFDLALAQQQEEKLTITTYYPSPTGVYQTLKVVDKAEFNTQRQGGHNHVVIHGAGPALNYGVLSFSAYNGANDVNTAGVWGFIESNTTGSEAGGLMFATKNETDALPVNRVTINRAGNVGLGVYPDKKLHINARAAISFYYSSMTARRPTNISVSSGCPAAGQGIYGSRMMLLYHGAAPGP